MANKCNFTPPEMELLNKLVNKYRPIIECKITKRVFNEKKDLAWKLLAREFNASSGIIQRSAAQLRNKYKNSKKTLPKPDDSNLPVLETEEDVQKALSAIIDLELATVEVTQAALEGSNDCNGLYESTMELVEDTSNDENTDTECATGESAVVNDTISETSKSNDQCIAIVNSSTLKNKGIQSTTMTSCKRKLNTATESTDIVTEIAKARKAAIEEENKLFLEFKRTEHMALMVSLKKDDEYKKLQHEMLVQEHKIKMHLLSAKVEHYKLLNAQIKQSMKTVQ